MYSLLNRRPIALLAAVIAAQMLTAPAGAAPPSDPNATVIPDPPDPMRIEAVCSGRQFDTWDVQRVKGRTVRMSAPMELPAGSEINHHRLTVEYEGRGDVRVSVGFDRHPETQRVINKASLRGRFRSVESGETASFVSRHPAQRVVWMMVDAPEAVEVHKVTYSGLLTADTVYGHAAGEFAFAGGTLPFRLMYPKDYDPNASYPLVISVHGSGGVGLDNRKSMEPFILARYLYTRYYDDPNLACISLVPQIVPGQAIPAPYWPKGPQGAPDRYYRPDWPAVNEQGFYTQATLALIDELIESQKVAVDPDRVYYTGFSYGGKACWEFLRAGRETFAGALCVAGWPIGRAYADPAADPTGRLAKRLGQELGRHAHIPVRIFAGSQDRMRFGSQAAHQALQSLGADSEYVEHEGANHLQSAGRTWGRRSHVAWLFEQRKSKNPPAGKDPFPGGAYDD